MSDAAPGIGPESTTSKVHPSRLNSVIFSIMALQMLGRILCGRIRPGARAYRLTTSATHPRARRERWAADGALTLRQLVVRHVSL